MPQGRTDQALQEFQKALALDPLSAIVNTNYGSALTQARRFPEALAQFQKVQAGDPNFPAAHYKLSQLYAMMGRFGDAVTEIRAFTPNAKTTPDAKGYCDILLQALSPKDADTAAAVGTAYALAGDRDHAFQYLEKAYAAGDNELLWVIRYPALDSLRSDPRFADLMRRLGLPQ
jgi:predicted Zn-dependent protease